MDRNGTDGAIAAGRLPGPCPEDPAQSEGCRLQRRLCRVRGPMAVSDATCVPYMGCPQHKTRFIHMSLVGSLLYTIITLLYTLLPFIVRDISVSCHVSTIFKLFF